MYSKNHLINNEIESLDFLVNVDDDIYIKSNNKKLKNKLKYLSDVKALLEFM